MTHEAKELLQRVLGLPDNERAELAANLIASLDEVSDPDADLAWQREVTRRMNDVQTGKVNTVSRDEVQRKARSMLMSIKQVCFHPEAEAEYLAENTRFVLSHSA